MAELTATRGTALGTRAALAFARLRGEVLLAVVDAVVVAAAFTAALVLRFDGKIPAAYAERLLDLLPFMVAVVLGVGWCWGLYGQIWMHASILEARRVLLAGASTALVLLVCSLLDSQPLPLSVVAAGTLAATLLQGLVRFQARLFAFRRRSGDEPGARVVIIGAGKAGAALVRDMLLHPSCGLIPVALVDDDGRKHERACHGIRVQGSICDLQQVARSTGAQHAVLAVTEPPDGLVAAVSELAERAGLLLRVLPALDGGAHRGATVRDVRDVRIEDLLGRQPVKSQLDSVHGLLRGRRVLITGAGGSIGSEIARQVAVCGPAQLLLVDNDETHLFEVATRMTYSATQVLLDIRDRAAVERCFEKHRPDVVFHAAAHKHVPLLEDFPSEAVKTNVDGTRNVTEVAASCGVRHFMFVSTDKAVCPRAVMGATKAVGEQLVLTAAGPGRLYSAVRFGNVLGSRGSVVPTFTEQIRTGGPVTLTDPRMTRFFMTIPEAVQLVLVSTAMARGGEVFMLDMGAPVRILDLARRMIRLSGRRIGDDVEIRVTGVRPGEKLEEELHAPEEQVWPTSHPSIVRLDPIVIPLPVLGREVARLVAAAQAGLDDAVRNSLFALVARRPWLVDDQPRTSTPQQRAHVIDLRKEPAWSSSTT